ncbi:MAG: hypoxanthine-guanine phosphoribosyltransferase [Candidatus Competibacterales bacterium]|nr:hypoxanthine-guanine phosphoribosyltransferase [Candidatus Competibacterales bacterium]
MSHIDADQARAVLREADLLCPAAEVDAVVRRMAARISERLEDADPLVLVVMNGALLPASLLFVHMDFPFQISYMHVTRYRGATHGGEIRWVARPGIEVQGRTVLVIDDIFDEGHTLKAIVEELRAGGATAVYSAVLVDKRHDRKVDLTVDFVGLEVPDRYVFGCGMDYKEYWRNLPAIYAVKGL